ncbi:MAG: DUF2589 domain-containing protein [Chlorobium sp.]
MPNENLPDIGVQALPLEFIISAPLLGVINAQKIAAQATLDFINTFKEQSVELNITSTTAGQASTLSIKAPLLAIVPVPHLRIDSFTTHFKYEISQVASEKKSKEMGGSAEAGTTGLWANFVNASLKGNVSSQSSSESVMNRSGVLEITINASEAPIPEGLARLLNLLGKTIPAELPLNTTPAEAATSPEPISSGNPG